MFFLKDRTKLILKKRGKRSTRLDRRGESGQVVGLGKTTPYNSIAACDWPVEKAREKSLLRIRLFDPGLHHKTG